MSRRITSRTNSFEELFFDPHYEDEVEHFKFGLSIWPNGNPTREFYFPFHMVQVILSASPEMREFNGQNYFGTCYYDAQITFRTHPYNKTLDELCAATQPEHYYQKWDLFYVTETQKLSMMNSQIKSFSFDHDYIHLELSPDYVRIKDL